MLVQYLLLSLLLQEGGFSTRTILTLSVGGQYTRLRWRVTGRMFRAHRVPLVVSPKANVSHKLRF